MGLCGSSQTAEEKQAAANSKKLEQINRNDFKKEQQRVKLLLLGAGESGKSTIFKQLKILYSAEKGYTAKEREQAKPYIYSNVFTNMKTVLDNTEKYGPVQNEGAKSAFLALARGDDEPAPVINASIAATLKDLWSDPGMQATWKERANFQVQDALKYYMENIDRISADKWVPKDDDILRSRVRTTGIQEESYIIDGVEFAIFDVGGQRNERKKWIHAFDNVTAVIFVAAISEYDQVLYEDSQTNRIEEAVKLFDEICNSSWFSKTSIILFLNKNDLFVAKLKHTPLRIPGVRYDDFAGPYADDPTVNFEDAVEAAHKYMTNLFVSRKRDTAREVYAHVTEATDTKQVHVVFNACKDIILRRNLTSSGFMD